MPPRLPAATSSRVESSYSRGLLHHQRSLRGHQQHHGASALQEADFAKACCCCKRKSFFCACFSLNEIKDSGVHWVDTQRHARANFGKLLAFSPSFFLFDLFRHGLATSQGLCKWHTGDAAVLAVAHLLVVEYWACPLFSLMNVVASMVFCKRSLQLTGRPLTRTSKEKEWPGNDRRERYYLGGNEN